MGITTALNTSVGSYPLKYFKMYKLLVAAAVAVCVSAEADPGVLVAAPALYNAYPNWPGVSTPYSQSTCYGCRPYVYGKRSADAEPEADAALLYGAYGYAAPYGYGYPYAYGYGLGGVAAHPGFATSFTQRSPQGLRGKRSAEPVLAYAAGLPYAPIVPVTTSTYGYGPSGYGIAQGRPGAAVSHQFV